jgi:uncharacterized protein (DUF4415 family)
MSTLNTHDHEFTMADEYDFSSGTRGRFYKPHKVATTIRLDNDVLLYFKKMSSETKQAYQTLMNNALRAYINHHGDQSEAE